LFAYWAKCQKVPIKSQVDLQFDPSCYSVRMSKVVASLDQLSITAFNMICFLVICMNTWYYVFNSKWINVCHLLLGYFWLDKDGHRKLEPVFRMSTFASVHAAYTVSRNSEAMPCNAVYMHHSSWGFARHRYFLVSVAQDHSVCVSSHDCCD
jgi:hypothetical protein